MRSAAAALTLLAAACAHHPRTSPLPAQRPSVRYAFDQLQAADDADALFVCLSFSGGGTRAAAFSYGVLQKLRDTPVVNPKSGTRRSLLEEVDCISSVSGGSFTSAYYALFGERVFTDFRKRFLDRDIQGELKGRALNPFNWPRLLSPRFSRIDLAAELYDETVFERKTYRDLLQRQRRPFIVVNTTDVDSGDQLAFTQDDFDLLGADLGAFPVARAVAASSAFPFLLTPITLENHAQPAWFVEPVAYRNARKDYFVNRRTWRWATNRAAYLDKKATPYVHVMDGGLADNIGLRALQRELELPIGFVARRYNTGKITKLLVLAVNAKNQEEATLNREPSPPGLVDVAFKTATVSMDNYSFETIELLRDRQRQLRQARREIELCNQRTPGQCPTLPGPTDIYVVDINLEAVKDPDRRRRLLAVPTNFSLAAADVQGLIDAAGELLEQNRDFAAFRAGVSP